MFLFKILEYGNGCGWIYPQMDIINLSVK